MKTLLNLKLSPAMIIGSVLFWFVLCFLIYLAIFLYWMHKMIYSHDKTVNVYDGSGTVVLHKAGKTIYRKELKFYIDSLKPLVKR